MCLWLLSHWQVPCVSLALTQPFWAAHPSLPHQRLPLQSCSLFSDQILIYSHSQPPWCATDLSLLSYECVILSLDPSSAFLCHISQIQTGFSGKALVDYFSSSSPSPCPPTPYRYIIFCFWTYLATKIMFPSLILSSASYSCSDSCSTVQNNLAPYPFPTTIKGVPTAFSFIFSQICSSVFPAAFLLSNGHLDLDDQTNCFCCSHINP